MAEISIHIINSTDTDKLNDTKSLFREMYEYLGTKGQMLPLKGGGEELWLEGIRNTLGRFGILIGAFEDEKLVGFIHGAIKFSPNYLGTEKIGFLTHQYLIEEVRGRGIGSLLFDKLEKWFEEKEVSSIEIHSNFLNNEAHLFYKKFGYQDELVQFRKILKL